MRVADARTVVSTGKDIAKLAKLLRDLAGGIIGVPNPLYGDESEARFMIDTWLKKMPGLLEVLPKRKEQYSDQWWIRDDLRRFGVIIVDHLPTILSLQRQLRVFLPAASVKESVGKVILEVTEYVMGELLGTDYTRGDLEEQLDDYLLKNFRVAEISKSQRDQAIGYLEANEVTLSMQIVRLMEEQVSSRGYGFAFVRLDRLIEDYVMAKTSDMAIRTATALPFYVKN